MARPSKPIEKAYKELWSDTGNSDWFFYYSEGVLNAFCLTNEDLAFSMGPFKHGDEDIDRAVSMIMSEVEFYSELFNGTSPNPKPWSEEKMERIANIPPICVFCGSEVTEAINKLQESHAKED